MAFCKEIIAAVNRAYAKKRERAIETANEKKEKLYRDMPALFEIERQLSLTAAELVKEAASGSLTPEAFEKIKKKNEAIKKRREKHLRDRGYPSDYLDIKFECPACEDTGYIGTAMCACYENALKNEAYQTSVLARCMPEATFGNFRFSCYDDTPDESGLSARSRSEKIFGVCRDFADDFENQKKNLLLHGPVGVGKTFLSGAISRELLQKGYYVVYDTAYNIFAAFEREKFQGQKELTLHYFDCDLLIVDDLGTELVTPFTVSALYNLINTRLLLGKKMVVNTNYDIDELENAYTRRVTVRLVREFLNLEFM